MGGGKADVVVAAVTVNTNAIDAEPAFRVAYPLISIDLKQRGFIIGNLTRRFGAGLGSFVLLPLLSMQLEQFFLGASDFRVGNMRCISQRAW